MFSRHIQATMGSNKSQPSSNNWYSLAEGGRVRDKDVVQACPLLANAGRHPTTSMHGIHVHDTLYAQIVRRPVCLVALIAYRGMAAQQRIIKTNKTDGMCKA